MKHKDIDPEILVIDFGEFEESFDKQLKRAKKALWLNLDWWNNLWENCADQYDWYEFIDWLHRRTFGTEYDQGLFMDGWQHILLNHPDRKQAKIEVINILFGWW